MTTRNKAHDSILKFGSNQPHRIYTVGPLRVDLDGHYVFLDNKEIPLSRTQMRFLVYLISVGGRVCSRKELLDLMADYSVGYSARALDEGYATRAVDAHMKRLRDKLGKASSLVETVRGVGYRLGGAYPIGSQGPI
ncbi:MAG: winged helix-turn-helix domain-containing protein [Pseudomonadota bacterium]